SKGRASGGILRAAGVQPAPRLRDVAGCGLATSRTTSRKESPAMTGGSAVCGMLRDVFLSRRYGAAAGGGIGQGDGWGGRRGENPFIFPFFFLPGSPPDRGKEG